MAIPPTDDRIDRDRTLLAEFLMDVQELLGSALDDASSWFPPELQALLRDAWEELEPSFKMADRYLREPPDARLLDAQLAHVGLTDRQLRMKLLGLDRAGRAFNERVSRRTFGRVLGWINIILGSLAGLIPGGDAIKEFKEGVERAVEDGEDEETPAAERTPPPEPRPFKPSWRERNF